MNDLITLMGHSGDMLSEVQSHLPEHWQRQLENSDGFTNDQEALQFYLATRCQSVNTRSGVLRDLRKLTWFIENHAGKDINFFSEVGIKTAASFQHWLMNPLPEDIGPIRPANSEEWRPMNKAASEASCNAVRSNLMAFWDFMINTQYLISNPWRALKPRTIKKKPKRHLPVEAFQIALSYLEHKTSETKGEQSLRSLAMKRWLILLYAMTGSRLEACTNATLDDIQLGPDGPELHLFVKGGKYHNVVWTESMQAELERYRAEYGMSSPASTNQPRHLILSTRRGMDGYQGVSPKAVRDHIKNTFTAAADWYSAKDGASTWLADTMRNTTTHWLRHGMISAMINELGGDIHSAQDQAGHRSISTTEIYREGDSDKRRNDLDRLSDILTSYPN